GPVSQVPPAPAPARGRFLPEWWQEPARRHPMARTSDDRRPDTWDDCEAAVSAALARMRELAGGPAAVGPDAAALGLVDVVRGSAGVWQAFWLHADLTAASEVCAVVPDLRPLIDVAEGT